VDSSTRTSKNSWLSRNASPSIESIFKRASDLLRMDDKIMHHSAPNGSVENMQVVYYGANGAHYAAHQDWGVQGGPWTRFSTLLLYLNDMPSKKAHGETWFPKAMVGSKEGLGVHPGLGNAVLFYDQHSDGNVDELALHEVSLALFAILFFGIDALLG